MNYGIEYSGEILRVVFQKNWTFRKLCIVLNMDVSNI